MQVAFGGQATERFQHQAVFYSGLGDFVCATVPFVQEGVRRREPVLVVALPNRIRALRAALGRDCEGVAFVDMQQVGANPARIIPVWRRFIDESVGERAARGVGEPVWSSRRDLEIEECRLHESLLNLAFDDGPPWQLMCPYDVAALPAAVIADAMRTHPVVSRLGSRHVAYGGHAYASASFAAPLPPEPETACHLSFGRTEVPAVRRVVRAWAHAAGLSRGRTDHLVVAANELATNSLVHGGGKGELRAWTDPGTFVLQVTDRGRIADPLVGRKPAVDAAESGRGVWIVNQLCDLVQVRSSEAGTTVRLHSWL